MIRRLAHRIVKHVRARAQFAVGVWVLDFPPFLMPWARLHREPGTVSALRRRAMAVVWKERPLLDRLALVVVGVAWPFTTAVQALRLVRRHGVAVRARTGTTPLAQWLECVRLANSFGYSPDAYYGFRFYELATAPQNFIQVLEGAALVVEEIRGRGYGDIGDKLTFADACARAGLATPPLVAMFAGPSTERWWNETGTLPRCDLFLKQVRGEHGTGAERWTYDAASDGWARRGQKLSEMEMLAHCRRRGSAQAVLLQHAIRNHPVVEQISGDALSSIRVVTFRDDGMPATSVGASCKVARRGADVDNISAGGMGCSLDLETLKLGIARGGSPAAGEHTHHPDTGAPVLGVYLSCARDAISLALAAHEKLDVPWSVGWDVAMTPEGPVLLEGNPLWSFRATQVPHGAPLPEYFTSRLLVRTDPSNVARGS